MLLRISASFARWLQRAGAIAEDEIPVYEHTVYCFFFTLIPLVLVSIIGLALGMFLEGLLMILPFFLLRKFSGGIHLSSSVVCFVSSTSLLTALLACVRIISDSEQYTPFSVFVLVSAIIVFVLSPIDSAQRRLSDRERKVFKRIARIFVSLISAVYALLMFLGFYGTAIPIGMGIVITALLQIPCFLKTSRRA